MTISVKVKVWESANWDAHVFAIDHATGGAGGPEGVRTQIAIVKPGEEFEYSVWDSRDILVTEVKH